MNNHEFIDMLTKQMDECEAVLGNKGREYASDEDRLHNFKVAAALEDVSLHQALAGMMAKHTVSIFDMCKSEKDFPLAVWSEKITDHINYLILLRAIVQEESQGVRLREPSTKATSAYRRGPETSFHHIDP